MMEAVSDVTVVGAGPAGCGAAVQSLRLGLEVTLLDSTGRAGGLVEEARLIENYPGLPEPVPGHQFADRLREWIKAAGISLRRFHVDSVAREDHLFAVMGDGGMLLSRSVIIASGTVPDSFSIPVRGGAVIHRSIIELKDAPPERAVIIGGGEAALDYALNLLDRGSRVTVMVRGSRLKASGRLREEALSREGMTFLYNTSPVSASSSQGVVHLVVQTEGEQISIDTDALIAAVGRRPRLPVLRMGCRHAPGRVHTSVEGLFIAGDASLGTLGQSSIAAGQGVRAAMLAHELIRKGHEEP